VIAVTISGPASVYRLFQQSRLGLCHSPASTAHDRLPGRSHRPSV